MEREPSIIAFPTDIPDLPQAKVVRVALESSGHVDRNDLQVLRLDHHRRLFILLENEGDVPDEVTMQNLMLSGSLVDEAVFSALPEKHPFEHIGRACAWLPQISLEGRLAIDDVVPVPWRQVLENTHFPPKAAVVVGTLSANAKLFLPSGISGQQPGREYFVFGQNIRTTDTFPNRPGGGTRMVA